MLSAQNIIMAGAKAALWAAKLKVLMQNAS